MPICSFSGDEYPIEELTHVDVMISGVKYKHLLCPKCVHMVCGNKQSLWNSLLSNIFSLLHLDKTIPPKEMNSVLSSIKDKDDLNNFLNLMLPSNSSSCPVCKTTFRDIMNTSKLGCATCYSHFTEHIKPVIKNVQGDSCKHVGKKPKGNDIGILNSQLDAAVKEERYEEAAIIRDQIKSLKGMIG